MDRGKVTVIRRHPADCPGCLGNGGCWVCLATGELSDRVYGVHCHRCNGTGMCAELPGVVVLPQQVATGS